MNPVALLGQVFLRLGLTRDSALWFWTRIVSVAGIVAAMDASGGQLIGLSDYYGFHLSAVAAHRIIGACIAMLWLSGKYDASPLRGKSA